MRIPIDVYIFYCKSCRKTISDTSFSRFKYKVEEHLKFHETIPAHIVKKKRVHLEIEE